MKSPEEIKKGLECCFGLDCGTCPYMTMEDECRQIFEDALAYIQQLERERDAAVEDMTELMNHTDHCMYCKYIDDNGDCQKPRIERRNGDCWVWRGAQEVKYG